MAEQYDNKNKIAIFVNKNEKGTENAPMLTGKVDVEGVAYKVALWARTSTKDGSTFWSGTIKKAEENYTNNGGLPPGATANPATAPSSGANGYTTAAQPDIGGDDIPF